MSLPAYLGAHNSDHAAGCRCWRRFDIVCGCRCGWGLDDNSSLVKYIVGRGETLARGRYGAARDSGVRLIESSACQHPPPPRGAHERLEGQSAAHGHGPPVQGGVMRLGCVGVGQPGVPRVHNLALGVGMET